MKEYDVRRGDTLEDLIGAVEISLENGWECQGGISVTSHTQEVHGKRYTSLVYHQAVVKETKKEKSKRGFGS